MTITGRPPKLTPAEKSRLLFLYTIGTPIKVLAQMHGLHDTTVRAYIHGTHKNPELRTTP